jgi:hypothetical protein
MSIDDRDPFVVAIVGNTSATKTTLILALAEQAMTGAVPPLGLTEFSPTEAARRTMRQDLQLYRSQQDVKQTDEGRSFYEPMEFLVAFGPSLPNVVLLIHDIAGETFMEPDSRLERAVHLLWADAVVFVVNPEETPGIGTLTSDTDQSAVLTGVYDDIVHGTSLRRAAGLDDVPPLVLLLSKADLLGEHSLDGPDPEEPARVARTLERLGAVDILLAAKRWPNCHMLFVAPQPRDGQPSGVVKAFEHVFTVMTGRQP